ncbi:hypothetical protein CMI38_02305 [Candidatus Pacearchaeota archaeon]|jgi:hypothetical protein|nr:hypothetical protein [Candidatus Pacearchaeota archaeon]|tara:strand:+ start:184 stop:429 length:246 start_codon:yes stop_codon:yes gene_type:complete
MNNQTYEIHYDEEGDFLEVFFGEPSKCYTEEPEQGVLIRKDQETDKIKSIGIIAFSKRIQILRKILNQINMNLPLEISLPE